MPCQAVATPAPERHNVDVRALSPSTTATTSLLALGYATSVAQAVLLREGMTALGGSGLAWGAGLALWLWAVAVIVPAVGGGWSFPVAAAALRGAGGAATAYALESGGAMAGGLVFTFLLAQQGSVAALSVAAGGPLGAGGGGPGAP